MRYLKYIILIIGLSTVSTLSLKAQLTIEDILTDVQLVEQVLLGEGVQVSNITSTASGQAIGRFDTGAGHASVPMSGGIILSTGNIFDAPGPNSAVGTSTDNAMPGDFDIEAIIGLSSSDAAVIEFDFKTPADTVRFNYIFASEEYREYVCDFNDAFAFLLTGPNPLGGNYTNQNIALVPGTSTEVAISTVNNGDPNSTCPEENANSGLYVDNTGGLFVEYDGLTQMFTAVAVVEPCQLYHIKIVIADAVDAAYDSAVFLEANSFGAIVDTLIADFVYDEPGCVDEDIQFINAGPTGPGISYEWTFYGPASQATSTDENPSTSWSVPGLHQVDLKIVINCGMDSSIITKYVNVHERPEAGFTFTNNSCEDNSVQFTNTGSSGVEFTHEWIFTTDANPTDSYSENPLVEFSEPGLHPIQHIVSNDYCTRVLYDTINIIIGPQASFTHTGPICSNQAISFTNTGTSAGVTYAWSFTPDGAPATSTDENPSGITFATSGLKMAYLTVTDIVSGCQQTFEDDFQVFDVPVADFSFTSSICIGTSVNFTNIGSSDDSFSYLWDFGPNAAPTASTAENPLGVVFDGNGNQDVTFTISNAACSSNITLAVPVSSSPAPEVSFSSTAPKCDGETVDFLFDLDPTDLDFDWNFGVNATPTTSTDVSPADISFSTYGVQIITLNVTNQLSGCNNSVTQTIVLYETPTASFTFTDSVCIGAMVDFTNSGSSGLGFMYSWDFGNGASPSSSNAENPTGISYPSNGNRVVSLTVSNAHCIASFTDTLHIKNSPAPILDFSSNSPVCTDSDITFSISDFNPGLIYAWTFGPDATPLTSAAQTPIVQYANDGLFTVQLFVTDPTTSCDNYVEEIIQVFPRPDVSFTSDAPVCIGESVSFTNTGSSGAEYSYSWDFGQGSNPAVSNSENPLSVTYTSSGSKIITLSISDNNCTRTINQTIYINPSPIVDFTTNAPQCTGQPVQMHNLSEVDGAATYAWTFGGSASMPSSSEIEPLVLYTTPGTHSVDLIVTNTATGCMDSISSTVNIFDAPNVAFTSNAPFCPNEPVSFTNEGSTGGEYSFSWNFGRYGIPSSSTSENPSGITFYQGGTQDICLTVYNNECGISVYETIEILNAPIADAGLDTIICANRSVLIGTPEIVDNTYFWFPSSLVDDNLLAEPLASPITEFTNYYLTVTDTTNGCTSIDSVKVTMLPPTIANAGQDITACENESVQIGTGEIQGQEYLWEPSLGLNYDSIPNPTAFVTETITYTVNVTSAGCDTVSDEVTIRVHALPIIDAGEDQTISIGDQTNITATGGVNYYWTPVEFINNQYLSQPLVYPDDTITYVVVGTDVFGCRGTDSVTINVKVPEFYIPNSFTPNDDGRNDVFFIRGNNIEDFKLQIFNRLNQSIFITDDFNAGWNGTIQNSGKDCPEGAYVYIVTGVDELGEPVAETGIVNLIR
jgi:gliding motility-associated-like protein